MDKLFQLIDERIAYMAKKMPFISSLPCEVTEVLDNNMVKVQLFSDGAIYTVPNWSGSALRVGENAHLFFRGSTFSESTAYVGAAPTRLTTNYVVSTNKLGELLSTEREVATIYFSNYSSKLLLICNACVQGNNSSNGSGNFKIYIDNVLQDYIVRFSVIGNGYETVAFTLPYELDLGSHKITIGVIGEYANLTAMMCYVYGAVETYEPPYTPTEDSDYIWNTSNGEASVLYYIGDVTNPIVPDTHNGNPVTTLEATAFNYTNVTSVYIPDGIEKIE